MEGDKEPHESSKFPVPSIDQAYIRNTEEKIAALHIYLGELRTEIYKLVDVGNNLGHDEHWAGSTASHVTQQREKELAAQINKLEAEEHHDQEEVQRLEGGLREHWATYAAFHCRGFCDRVRERLPRELRMMVFDALWGDAHHTITDWNLQAFNTTPENAVGLVESWSGRDTEHCFEPRFVGTELQGEILQAWWGMSVFEFKTAQLIPVFLSKKFWGETVKDRVQRAVVDLSYREHTRWFGGLRVVEGVIKAAVTGVDLDAELGCLSHLSHDTKITVSIKKRDQTRVRDTVEQRQNWFLQAATHMFPGLERLQKDGYVVSILLDRDIEIKLKDVGITTEEWWDQICKAAEAFDKHQYDEKEGLNNSRCWPLQPRHIIEVIGQTYS